MSRDRPRRASGHRSVRKAGVFSLFVALALGLFTLNEPLLGRDINLDEIYFKKPSRTLSKLTLLKLEAYQRAAGRFVDRDVIFAGWLSGQELFYIKEFRELNFNTLYRYHIHTGRSTEILKIPGVVTVARAPSSGKFVAMKRLILSGTDMPRGETLLYAFGGKKLTTVPSSSAFLDFDLPAEGESFIYESEGGFTELFPDSGIKRLVMGKDRYPGIESSGNPSIAFYAPGRRSVLVINGGGGSYAGRLISGRQTQSIKGISSAGEVAWISPHRFVYRSGHAGYFSVIQYDTRTRASTQLLGLSMHTNICYSPNANVLSFLKDHVIHIRRLTPGKDFLTGLEGEDVSFSALGGNFSTILFKKLFIVNLETLQKRQGDLRRCWEEILAVYLDAKGNRLEMVNEYSLDYVNRKIHVYTSLLNRHR
jgi:hypothetical protein